LCLDLTVGDSNPDLSGMIDIQTLSAYSSMFAHYNPVIQSDEKGNPIFVSPPPPPDENTFNLLNKSPAETIIPQETSFESIFISFYSKYFFL